MHLKTYHSLGVEPYNESGREAIANCRFCGSGKFYINTEEGLFSCKVCGIGGNKYTFMGALYDDCFKGTTKEQYDSLAKLRGIPREAFRDAELAYDSVRTLWYIPIRNEVGSVVNLRQWDKATNKLVHTAGCSATLYNVDRMGKARRAFVCEGEWDAIAMEWMLGKLKITDTAVVAVPGASTFKEEWCGLFNDREVFLLYDNDKPGQSGLNRTLGILRKNCKPRKLSKLVWPEGLPDKYDIRDWVIKNQGRMERAYSELGNMMEEVSTREAITTSGYTRFSDVADEFRKHVFFPQEMETGLLISLATLFSNKIPGNPLWTFLVGPPGSGKSLLLQTLSDNDLTHYESSLGAKTLVSGFKTSDGSDPSLLPKIIGKTLVIKEYTEILGLPGGEQENIFAVLRGAYDGRVERTYPHGVVRIYPEPGSDHKTCHFSILAGVTNAIHGDSRAALGERFLKYQLFPDNYDPVAQVKSAMSNAITLTLPEYELRECVNAFVEHKLRTGTIKIPDVPEPIKERIIGLASIVSIVRANVARKSGELQYRPAAEVGTRLSTQLVRLAQCVAFTLDRPAVDEQIYREVAQRVALDTCYGWHRDVVLGVSYHYPNTVLKEVICKENRIGSGTANRCLEDLYELGALEYDLQDMKGKMGRPPRLWKLSPTMENMFKQANLLNTDLSLAEIPDSVRYQIRRRGKEAPTPIA